MLVALALAVALAPPVPRATGPCDLLDPATVTALLGTPAKGMSAGPEPDEDTDGQLSYCSYREGRLGLIVSQVEFKTAAAARKATTEQLVRGRLDDEVIELKEQPGVGDKAYWAYTERGGSYTVLTGANVVSVALGGGLPKPPKTYQDALRAAATAAVSKM
jgi:hypothetical protein